MMSPKMFWYTIPTKNGILVKLMCVGLNFANAMHTSNQEKTLPQWTSKKNILTWIYIMANLKERFFALCTPAQVYLVLALFSGIISIFSANDGVIKTLIWLLFVILWTLVLNFLCSKGLSGVSWALVLLPYIVILFTLVFITSGIFSGKIRVKK